MEIKEMLDELERKSNTIEKINTADYVKGGLIYCGKCNTPKQHRIRFNGKTRVVNCICECEKKRQLEEAREMVQRLKQEGIKMMKRIGFPDPEMEKWTFDADDHKNEKISTMARNYVENFGEMKKAGKGLLLYGSVGTGKTFISACIANALIEEGRSCLVTNFARLVNTISGMYDGKQEYIDGLNQFDLLVIDDLASERDTEYMGEIVQNIIDSRYRSNLPLIITTNLTSDELKHPSTIRKERIYSRLIEMCVPVEVKGSDRRKEKLINNYREFKEMLGI